MLQENPGRFLGRPNIAVLTWVAAAGEPAATPVWYRYRDGKFLVHTVHPSAKTRAIGRNANVCLCVQTRSHPIDTSPSGERPRYRSARPPTLWKKNWPTITWAGWAAATTCGTWFLR